MVKAKVRKKGFEDGEIVSQVFFTLYHEARPMTTYEISKKTKLSWKLVDYHLPKLLQQGLILKEDDKYLVNPIFIDEDLWDIYYGFMKLLVSYISDKLVLQCGDKDKEQCIMNILRVLPTLFSIEVKSSL